MVMPANVSYGTVTWQALRAVADGADSDRDPDGIPLEGLKVRFEPSAKVFKNPEAPVTIIHEVIEATTNSDGELVGPDNIPGVRLLATDDPDLLPSGWTWRVSISGPGVPTITFSFMLPSDGVVDLTTVVPVPSNPGTALQEWQAAVNQVQALVVDAESSIPELADTSVATEVADQVNPRVEAAQAAQTAAEQARNETIVTVAAQSDWSGAVTLSQAQSKSAFLRRRLTGNTTLTLAAGEAGKAYSCSIRCAQDAVGGRTLTLANVATAYGVPIVLSTGANAVDIVRVEWDGTAWTAFLGAAQVAIPTGWIV